MKNKIPEEKRKKILFVIPSLSGGGAERIFVYLMRFVNKELFHPHVVVLHQANADVNLLSQDIDVIHLNKKAPRDFFRLMRQFSKIVKREKPALVVSFVNYANYLTLFARAWSHVNVPVLLTVHNNLSSQLENERFGRVKKTMMRLIYPRADGVISVSRGVQNDFVKNYYPYRDKCSVIYNPVAIEEVSVLAKEQVTHPWFSDQTPVLISCGRLAKQKNYPLLLRALTTLSHQTDIRLMILGQGDEKATLEHLADKLGISDKVQFLGFQSNPFKYIARATIFILSSLWEGFGNVLLEAMACGTPVISTNCPYGPGEIITDGVDGLLVPVNDVDALAGAILRLLHDEPLRKRLAIAGKKRAEDFQVEKMVRGYETVFEEMIR